MNQCQLCNHATNERCGLLSHLKEKHDLCQNQSSRRGQQLVLQERYVYEGKVRSVDGPTFEKYRLVKEYNPVIPSACSSVLSKKKKKSGGFKCETCFFTSSSKTSMEALEHKFACGKISKRREIHNIKIKSEEESDSLMTESNHYQYHQPSEAVYKLEVEENHDVDRLQEKPVKIKREPTSESEGVLYQWHH